MPTHFYNTLTHSPAPFTPLHPGPDSGNPIAGSTIKLYTCGPTVYDFAHIGNFRAFLFADVLRRFLEFRGATVHHVMNMTDVGHMTDDTAADASGEDKMALAQRRLKENKKTGKLDSSQIENPDDPRQIADYFANAFLADARALRLEVVQDYDAAPADTRENIMPRPTRWIPPFIEMIQTLIQKNHAYVAPDGVVYYDVHSFPAYGKLSGNSVDQLSHGAGGRTNDRAAKRHPADFFLWKPDPAHLMRWPSPWGEGYPGWHIECSAMATTILGNSIDIHTGGEDNIFPHHECEIAQSEGATGKTFAQFWMHNRHLLVSGEKMSKSKGNFYTIRDLVTRGFDPLAIRLALINTRYRETMNFTIQGLYESASAVTTLRDLAEKFLQSTDPISQTPDPSSPDSAFRISHSALLPADTKLLEDFTSALDDDLNISAALAAVFTWSAPLSKQKKIPADQTQSALAALKKIDHVLQVIFQPLLPVPPEKVSQVEALLAQRTQARASKDWPKSDELRNELLQLGIEIKDTPTATTWRPRLAPAL